jgi:hypothetical protein
VANTRYEKALAATFNKVAGRRYAAACLVVTGATAPDIRANNIGSASIAVSLPMAGSAVASQASLPSPISVATLTAGPSAVNPYFEFVR